MKCPYCKCTRRDRVVDSRSSGDERVIRRRRECMDCGRRFTTYERVEETPLRVIKKGNVRVPFDRNKIFTGLLKACEKRPISNEALEEVTDRIESEIHETFDREVTTAHIGEQVMDALRRLDQVAYVRFASVYREFRDLNEFMDELKTMLK